MTPDEREEIKRHFGVIAEGLRSDMRLVAEGVAMNTGRLDRHEKDFEACRDQMCGLRGEMHDFRDEMSRVFSEPKRTTPKETGGGHPRERIGRASRVYRPARGPGARLCLTPTQPGDVPRPYLTRPSTAFQSTFFMKAAM